MATKPFDALANIAIRSRESAKKLPQKIEAVPRWRGLGFELLGRRYAAPMGQVIEMMEIPAYTRLPAVQPWVVGLSNVRGRLLPLFDFSLFLGGQLGSQKKMHKVLVLEINDLFSGLIVERALGMQQFELSEFRSEISDGVPDTIVPYVAGNYDDADGKTWHVLDFLQLSADPRFTNASLL